MKLAPYPEYKDSGTPWLGRIPAHWENRKLRNMLTPVSVRYRPDLPLLSVVREKGVIKRNISSKEENRNYIPDDLSNYKVVKKSQFAMNKMKAWQGSYGISDFEGIVSPAYFVFDLDEVEGKFFHIATRSKAYVPFFAQASDGIRIGQWDLNQSRMKEIPFFVPSLVEQTQIARFLDWQTAQINKFIRNKQRLRDRLREQMEIMVFGADVSSRRSESSDWKGLFPNHWSFEKAKHVFEERKINNAYDKELLAVTQDRGVLPKSMCAKKYVSPGGSLEVLKLVQQNDFVISLRSFEGGIENSDYEGIVSPAYTVIRLRNDFRNHALQVYYRVLFKTTNFIKLLNTTISGIRDGKNILYVDFADLEMPVPPVSEIGDFLQAFIEYQSFVRISEREIELMREYRTRLISDVVTGKVDVRSIEVPEVAEEGLPALDEETTAEFDDVIDDEENMDETD